MWKSIFFAVIISISSIVAAEGQSLRNLKSKNNKYNRFQNRLKLLKESGKVSRVYDADIDTTDFIIWEKDPYIPNSGMIKDYEYLYNFLHSRQETKFINTKDDLLRIEWDSVSNIYYTYYGKDYLIESNNIVFGWHPYWMGQDYRHYNYNLLSMVSYYSYDINPENGMPSNDDPINSLKANNDFLKSFDEHHTKPILSVTSFGKVNNTLFLQNEYAQKVFIDSLITLLEYPWDNKRGFKGIDLNFEEVRPVDVNNFTQFIKTLSTHLGSRGLLIILDLPYYNENNLDYSQLNPYVNYFNILGYDFEGVQSAYPGSISPLRFNNKPSITSAINDLLAKRVPRDKIILSLPLYGVKWDVTNATLGKKPQYEEDLPWHQIASDYAMDIPFWYDPLSASSFMVFDEGNETKTIWFESAESLSTKFAFIREKGLAGVGFWALGYDQNAPEIWGEVKNHFGWLPNQQITPLSSKGSGPYGLVLDIIRFKKVIGVAVIIIVVFIFMGFIVSFIPGNFRNQILSFRRLKTFVKYNGFAGELIWFLLAFISSLPIAYLFINLMNLTPESTQLSQDEVVFQMEIFIIGVILGFFGIYLIRIIIWAATPRSQV